MDELYEKLNRSLECDKPTRETEVILETESDINAIDGKGNALLHCITDKNNIALLKIIIEKRKDFNLDIIRPPVKYRCSSTALLKSIQSKSTEVSKILINAGANVNLSSYFGIGITPLLACINNRDTELAVILINAGADINLSDMYNNSPLGETVISNNTELAKILIDAGADVNLCDSYKSTPLLKSIQNRLGDMTKLLINSGADVNLTDYLKTSPLHKAVYKTNWQIASILLEHNANINARNEDGKTPLMVLCCSKEYSFRSDIVLNLLLSSGADVNILDNRLQSPLNNAALISEEAVNKLLNHNPRFDALDLDGYSTIFIFFRQFVDENIILRAIEQGCCVKQKDPCGSSVLHYAIDINYKRVAYKLLSDGFDVNCRDHAGNTPLHKVCMGDAEVVCMLLYYGAEPNLLSRNNSSPLLKAIASGDHNCVDLLFFSYDSLNGDDCHQVVYAILKNPSANDIDMPTIEAMLAKFEKFVQNNKLEFWKYPYSCRNRCSVALIKLLIGLNAKIKSFRLNNYISFHLEGYYYPLISYSLSNPSLRKQMLSFVWTSLSLGITCNQWDFFRCSSVPELLFDQVLLALIWGSHTRELLLSRYNSSGIDMLLKLYFKLLHSDIESIESKLLLNRMLLSKNKCQVGDCESDGESEYSTKLFRFLSFFSTEEYRKFTGRRGYLVSGVKRHCYELPNSIKTLAEMSRDKARVFIMEKFKTKHFYKLHEIINNLDMPLIVKRFLQLRIPVNCKKCHVMWCNCDVDEVAKALCLDDVN